MTMERDTVSGWLTTELSKRFSDAIAGMAGKAPQIATDAGSSPGNAERLWWQQSFSGVSGAMLWIGADPASWTQIGSAGLAGAGIDHPAPEDCRGTYLELVQQSVTGLAASLTTQLSREVLTLAGLEAAPTEAGVAELVNVRFESDGPAASLLFIWNDGFADALLPSMNAPARPAPLKSDTADRYEMLLDVELPVSVSFGRAHLPLREVVKLTSGAIVELNRAVSEPVELIVNNCVVARGEVVVIDGNYGVRVKQIISRKERLRTLH